MLREDCAKIRRTLAKFLGNFSVSELCAIMSLIKRRR